MSFLDEVTLGSLYNRRILDQHQPFRYSSEYDDSYKYVRYKQIDLSEYLNMVKEMGFEETKKYIASWKAIVIAKTEI